MRIMEIGWFGCPEREWMAMAEDPKDPTKTLSMGDQNPKCGAGYAPRPPLLF